MSHDVLQFLTSIPWFAWIAIVAIVCGAFTQVVNRHYEYEERMEKIRQGINPDDHVRNKDEV